MKSIKTIGTVLVVSSVISGCSLFPEQNNKPSPLKRFLTPKATASPSPTPTKTPILAPLLTMTPIPTPTLPRTTAQKSIR